ncbi:MAG: pilus assembly protein PilM [Thermodesulfobacteriota bacterium]
MKRPDFIVDGIAKLKGLFPRRFPVFRPAVGIDIGSHSVKAVVLRNGSGGEDFAVSAGEIVHGSGADFDSIRQSLSFLRDDLGIRGAKAAVSVSGGEVFTSRLKVSADAPRRVMKDEVLLHLSRFFPEGMDGLRYDFWKDPDSPEDILIAVAKNDAVFLCSRALSSAGFVPSVVDCDCFALVNSHLRTSTPPDGLAVLLNVGRGATNFAVLEGTKTVLMRDLPHGSGSLTSEIAGEGGMTAEEAEKEKVSLSGGSRPEFLSAARGFAESLGREVKSNLETFLGSGAKAEKVSLSGGGSLLHGFESGISETLGAETVYSDPLRSACDENGGDHMKRLSPKSAVAFGLALRMTG